MLLSPLSIISTACIIIPFDISTTLIIGIKNWTHQNNLQKEPSAVINTRRMKSAHTTLSLFAAASLPSIAIGRLGESVEVRRKMFVDESDMEFQRSVSSNYSFAALTLVRISTFVLKRLERCSLCTSQFVLTIFSLVFLYRLLLNIRGKRSKLKTKG